MPTMSKETKHYCGECVHMKYKDTEGWGTCDVDTEPTNCGYDACKDFFSTELARHYIATLIQANRYRRDQHVPAIYKMPDPKELGRAIDFAVEIMKKYLEL